MAHPRRQAARRRTHLRLHRTPGRDVAPFIVGQLTGSVLGVAAGRLVRGPLISAPAVDYAVIRPAPGWSWAAVAAIEAVTMFISSPRLGPFIPWAVGTMIAAQIIAFGTLSGGIVNPAREFGPALLSGDLSLLPAYLLGPPAGAWAATAAIRPHRHRRRDTCRSGD
ncbi:aquaporin [Streptomyces diastatochromogenes]|uniref:aquaporin n=1 Tax=Streptomyces diastatochromogenes TaxID=42236 RepID=UPI00367529F5